MFSEYKDIVGIDELMEMLAIGKNTAYDLVRNKHVKSIRVGAQIRIPKTEIIRFVNESLEVQSEGAGGQ